MTVFNKVLQLAGITVIFILAITGCRFKPASLFPEKSHIKGLAGYIELQHDRTDVILEDYFLPNTPQLIDSVTAHHSLYARLSADKSKVYIRQKTLNVPYYSELILWIDEVPYTFLTRKPVKEFHTFHFDPDGGKYKNVVLSGDMNEWAAQPMALVDGKWQLTLKLEPGRYEYRIVADGREMIDQNNSTLKVSNSGSINSVVEAGSIDYASHPHIYTTGYRGYTIEVRQLNPFEQVFVLWDNFRLPDKNISIEGERLFITIPGDAIQKERSYIRIATAGKKAPGNDLLIPLHNGIPVMDASQLNSHDREAMIVYSIPPTGGDFIDEPTDITVEDNTADIVKDDKEVLPQWPGSEYLEELGINALLLSEVNHRLHDSVNSVTANSSLPGLNYMAENVIPQGTLSFRSSFAGTLTELAGGSHPINKLQIIETLGTVNNTRNQAIQDGNYNLNLYIQSRKAFALDDESFRKLDMSLHKSFRYYGFQHLVGNVTGIQDMPRFISVAAAQSQLEEEIAGAGETDRIINTIQSGYKKLSALTAFIFTIPGIPVVYYGDEIGLHEPDTTFRNNPGQDTKLLPQQEQVRGVFKKLTRLRRSNMALMYGDFITLDVTDNTFAFARSYFNNRVIVVFNKSNFTREVILNLPQWYHGLPYTSEFGAAVEHNNNKLHVSMPPLSFEILTFQ